ncbi:hypothetical protein QUF80_15930 [Desulfococcaceae bacterium HSG8]|nr:hypothetical protein [Desulfococcaceae bacterium HSG8]
MTQYSHPYPYPGLRPFQKREAELFFGREEQIEGLLGKLWKNRFVAVVGASGCGKSSLVNAGLLPALDMGFMLEAGEDWRIAVFRPGSRPVWNMAEAVYRALSENPDEMPDPADIAFAAAGLRGGPLGIAEAFREARLPEETNLLVLADQFEEIFRFREQQDVNEAIAFVELLLVSARVKNMRIYTAITMRSDYLGDCALFSELPEAMNNSQFLVPRLTRDQLRAAIAGPAAQFDKTVDPYLVSRLLNDMKADPDQLPLLQHALMRMWAAGEPLDVKLYESAGGLENALSRHADQIYEQLTREQQGIAGILFRCLTERSRGKRDTRRPVRLAEPAEIAGAEVQAAAEVAEIFRAKDRNFLTPPPGKVLDADTVIDISHESLIRQWKRLKDWVEEEAESADRYRVLESTALRWQKGEAGLWGSPDLDVALEWKERRKPSLQWARRYGKDFDLAMRFLDESEEKRAADEEAKRREYLERTTNLFDTYIIHASLLSKVEDYAAARETLSKTYALDKDMPEQRRHARNLMNWYADLMGGTADKVYEGAGAKLMNVAVSPDGNLLAGVGEKGTVVLFDETSGDVVKRLEGHLNKDTSAECDVKGVVFHPEGKWLATSGGDEKIILWSMPEGNILEQWEAPAKVWALALSPDGKTLASGGTDNAITLWDAETGKELKKLEGHEDSVSGLAFSPDGNLLASASYDRTAIIWDLKTRKEKHVLRGHSGNVKRVAFHPDKDILASSSSDKSIILWNVNTGRPMAQFLGHLNYLAGLMYIDKGRRLVSGSHDRTLRLWDTETSVTLRVLQGHVAGVTGVTAKGDSIYSAANDGTIRRWKIHPAESPLEKGMNRAQVVDLENELASSAISPDGNKVSVGFADGKLKMFSLPDLKLLWENTKAHSAKTKRIEFSPDGKYLASAGFDDLIKLWNTGTGELIQTFKGHDDAVHAVAFSPDGKFIASASYDGKIGLFKIGKEEGELFPAHVGEVYSVAFDASGKKLVSAGSEEGEIKLWNIQKSKPELIKEFPKSGQKILWAAISPDGRRVAAVGRDLLVHIFNANTGKAEHAFVGHEQAIWRVEFSPDGGQVATVSSDGTLRFWDLETKTELFSIRLPSHRSPPTPLWDFSFRCTGDCWLAVPLTSGKLVLYRMEGVYGD